MKMNVLIIGGGEMGGSLAGILDDHADVRVWDSEPSRRRNAESLDAAASDADVAIICVPSWHVDEAVRPLVGVLPESAVIVSLSKGLDTAGLSSVRVLTRIFPDEQPLVVLGGPMLAEEVGGQRAGVGVIASADADARRIVRSLLEPTGLFLEDSSDADSVALAGVLKNVYALFMGMVDELGYGQNLKGYFLSLCCGELEDLGYELGAESDLLRGTPGFGDFLATALSEGSLNAEIGRQWVRHGGTDRKSEGLISIEPLWNLLGETAEDFPVFATVYAITVSREGEAAELIAELVP